MLLRDRNPIKMRKAQPLSSVLVVGHTLKPSMWWWACCFFFSISAVTSLLISAFSRFFSLWPRLAVYYVSLDIGGTVCLKRRGRRQPVDVVSMDRHSKRKTRSMPSRTREARCLPRGFQFEKPTEKILTSYPFNMTGALLDRTND